MTQTDELKAFYYHDFKNSYIPNIFKEIYYDKVYQQFLEGKKDLTIVDWGANIGLTAHYFSDYGRVIAVEPSKLHQEALEAMIKQNKLEDKIKLCKYAISNKNGTEKFYHNDNLTMYSLKDNVNKKDDFEEVETLTAEEFIKREGLERIDLLKFDTEGNEGEIITSDGFRNIADKINVIVGEWHNWSSMSQPLFANTFRDLGFTFNWYNNTEASVFSAIK